MSGDQSLPVKPAVEDKRFSRNRVKRGEAKNSPLIDRKDDSRVVGTPLL